MKSVCGYKWDSGKDGYAAPHVCYLSKLHRGRHECSCGATKLCQHDGKGRRRWAARGRHRSRS